jgi:hypothetical protein
VFYRDGHSSSLLSDEASHERDKARTLGAVMTLGRQTSTLVPLQSLADINGEVVLIHHLVCNIFFLPVHYMRPG